MPPYILPKKKRIAYLDDPRQLFKPSKELAFLAGLTSALALNTNFILATYFGTWIDAVVAPGLQLGIYILGLLVILLIFGVAPIVGTLGLQIQKAAFVDRVQTAQQRFTSLQELVKLSVSLGSGFVLGCLASPFPHAFSMWGVPLFIIPFYVLGWAIIFMLWMVPLSEFSGRIYACHTGDNSPNKKRNKFTILSALALLPIFLFMAFAHISLSVRYFNPDWFPINNLEFWLFVGFFISFILHIIVWGIIWKVMSISKKYGVNFSWCWMPSPILLPDEPTPPSTSSTPPPINF